MKRIIGILIAGFYVVIAFGAFRNSAGGWAEGHSDLGVWWGVIGSFLGIAALGALIGTLLHTRQGSRT